MNERWLPIVGFEGIYEVSNHGRIRSFYGHREGQILSPWAKGPLGHQGIALRDGGPRTVHLVHRLVMAAFVGPCPEGQLVRHLDGDARNNHVENLAYGTQSENELDKIRHGTHPHGSRATCRLGHPLTPRAGGGRQCVPCANTSASRRYYVKREQGLLARCAQGRHAECAEHDATACACSCHAELSSNVQG